MKGCGRGSFSGGCARHSIADLTAVVASSGAERREASWMIARYRGGRTKGPSTRRLRLEVGPPGTFGELA